MNQADLLRELPGRYDALIARARELAGPLSGSRLTWSPDDETWSAAQVLDHVSQTVEGYLAKMRPALAKAPRTDSPESVSMKGGLAGALILKTLLSPKRRRLPAPRAFRPVPGTGDALARFEAAHRGLVDAMSEFADRDWSRAMFGTPVSPLLRASAVQAFLIHAVHAERHLGQLERLLARQDFPGA